MQHTEQRNKISLYALLGAKEDKMFAIANGYQLLWYQSDRDFFSVFFNFLILIYIYIFLSLLFMSNLALRQLCLRPWCNRSSHVDAWLCSPGCYSVGAWICSPYPSSINSVVRCHLPAGSIGNLVPMEAQWRSSIILRYHTLLGTFERHLGDTATQ